jgi:hypothetical protein
MNNLYSKADQLCSEREKDLEEAWNLFVHGHHDSKIRIEKLVERVTEIESKFDEEFPVAFDKYQQCVLAAWHEDIY